MHLKALLSALVILLLESFTFCIITSNVTDLHSLLAFKAAIEFDPGKVLANNWTSDTNFCDWYGVTCSKRRQRVTLLELRSMGLVGSISPHVGNLSFLMVLDLQSNKFHGQVIKEIGHLSRLQELSLYDNNLRGEIPVSLTTLPRLINLYLGINNLTGTIPSSFGNISTLKVLGLEDNKFHGIIPNEIALLPSLEGLNLGRNYLIGTIPPSLFNISILDLSTNSFTGDLPKDKGLQLPNLRKIVLGDNQLTGSIPSHFYNASNLTLLALAWNNFTGTLPAAMPLSLQILDTQFCYLQGQIPEGIGNLKNLNTLKINGNRFSGTIPPTIKGMESMQQLFLHENGLEGSIPEEICSLRNLGILILENNRLSGSIPECIGNLSRLQQLSLASNGLRSTIPQSLWSLDQLLYLELSSNSFNGSLGKNITKMKSLDILNLYRNQLSGNIPASLGSCQSLTSLDLSWNKISGPIPESFRQLFSLVSMNLSNNNLTGHIPKTLEALKYLKYLNLSYNNLSGEIPIGGSFVNFTPQSFVGNQDLCGDSITKSCPSLKKPRNKLIHLTYIVPLTLVFLIVGAFFYFYRKHRMISYHENFLQEQRPSQEQRTISSQELIISPSQEQRIIISQEQNMISYPERRMISYHELSHATNSFSEANYIGSGGFGHVYKGILSDGKVVAVKLINLTVDGAIKSFDAECKVLRTVRHRNLVKVISTCTNPELRALVLEYIPNGSLEKWLYSHNYCLSLHQRVSIMIDVAVALDYLHRGQSEPVIHCDLKPSNVLLDNDMVARVADFGIAKILAANQTVAQTSTLGTFGYIAPEYGEAGRVSTKGDVYSYGIMLLETLTRKKPTDEMFSEELSLRQWVSLSVSNRTTEVVDENLLNSDSKARSAQFIQEILVALLVLGLGCSRYLPNERFEMKDVVTKLNKIKLQILYD